MRDALSILDKIVSFTEGKLTYSNTLEHLNILDEDYYFKLIGHMQQQQFAEAMLLFDEINQKGFEGDTVLEGFADFLRNLLVCRDAKAAVLLDVADDFKDKFIDNAKNIDYGWLISALNIINEAVINYKQARNKKLHVELFLIKLCFLNQALQITTNENGLSKKKMTDTAKAVQFKSVDFIPIITNEKKSSTQKENTTSVSKLIVEKPPVTPTKKNEPVLPASIETSSATVPQLGSLQKIREKIALQNNAVNAIKNLTQKELEEAWDGYIQKLKENANHSAVTNFNFAKLKIIDELSFDIITESNIQMKFIESERAPLIEFFQQYFNNRQIKFQIILEEKEGETITAQPTINSKELYRILSEQYPQLKELKEKLKLEVGY